MFHKLKNLDRTGDLRTSEKNIPLEYKMPRKPHLVQENYFYTKLVVDLFGKDGWGLNSTM